MTVEKLLFEDISTNLISDVLYDIPQCISPKTAFRYVGTAGEGTMFKFVAEPGDWTVTLSPAQLLGRIQLYEKRDTKKAGGRKKDVW